MLSRMSHLIPYADWNFHSWHPGREMDWHDHAHLQIIHVLVGELEIDCGSGWRAHRSGDAHILPPGMRHRLRTRHGHSQFGLNFSSDEDERGLLATLRSAWRTATLIHLPAADLALGPVRNAAVSLQAEARLRATTALDHYCLALLTAEQPASTAGLAQRLSSLLSAHPDRSLAVTTVARRLKVTRPSLQRACHKAYGCGVATLHRRLRLAAAAVRLVAEDTGMANIARRCGYADIFQFSRAFSRMHGMAPTHYREAHRLRGG